jgi:ABC-type glycerol-3-phosphate transport system substrate-binding protein
MPTASASSDMTIMLMQFTTGAEMNQEQMEEALKQQNQQPNVSMEVVEERTETIRGEEVTVTVSESAASDTVQFRQWMAVFQGNKGPTVLMIQGVTNNWDDQLIEDFIESIH